MIVADVGATAREVSVGFTKKPRQPVARTIRDRVANVAERRSIRLKDGMIKMFPRTYFLWQCPLEVAAKNCSREGFGPSKRVYFCAH